MRNSRSWWHGWALFALVVTAIPMLWPRGKADAPRMPVKPGEEWTVPGEYVVELKQNAAPDTLSAMARDLKVSFVGELPDNEPQAIFTVSANQGMTDSLLARLRADSRVAAVEPQRLFRALWAPNDPRYKEQWNLRRIHTEQAWDVTHGAGATVAVIDTGVAFENDGSCYRCRDFDRTTFVDPYDFVHRNRHPMDDHGHGTHVTGTIAESTDNGQGMAGIAFEAKIMPLKVLNSYGSGRLSDIAAAVRYAADKGANVINMSLGAPFPDEISRHACDYARGKGVTIVCAAGNGGGPGVGYPAAYPSCIAVSALGPNGELAPYSSYGPQVAISAPGGDKTQGDAAGIIQNTYFAAPGSDKQQDDYFSFQGTSMACPHVAGVAALIVSRGVKDPEEVRKVLLASAQKRGPANKYGAGELDAAAAVRESSGATNGYRWRVWLVTGVWALCALGWRAGRRSMVTTALAITLGLFVPDLVAAFAGVGSNWNLLGHSVLIPLFLMVSEAESDAERRFYGVFAAGITAHLALDLLSGLSPLVGITPWAAVAWIWVNAVIGVTTFLSSLRR